MQVLIIGTLEGYMSAAGKIALSRGARVSHVDTIETAMDALRAGNSPDIVLVDVRLDVADLSKKLKQERISLPVIACGIGSDPKYAVEAIKAGAKEYIPLPPDPELIAAVLEAVAQEDDAVIYQDPKMQQVLDLSEKVAASNASILITGESGTGKEVISRFVHRKSNRRGKKFISVNCAAIPDNLLESELFGHEKGAFTGAVARRIGKFEEANGGTLLLDEVSEMHPQLQAKLLRAIQEREIDRIGGASPIKVDIRLLATTNRNLEDAVKEGSFREDLYFRLNVINVTIPPLRERPKDIDCLSSYFLDKYSDANGVPPKPFSQKAKMALVAYQWKGNVRELENAVHRAVLLSQGTEIEVNDIFLPTMMPSSAVDRKAETEISGDSFIGKSLSDVEQTLILDTLTHCLGNRTHAANILGISIRTLRNKLKQYSESGFDIPPSGEQKKASA